MCTSYSRDIAQVRNKEWKDESISMAKRKWLTLMCLEKEKYADLRARRKMPMVIGAPSCGSDEQNDGYLQSKRNETSGK